MPALGSVLYAREVPDAGGDTMFANQYLAYETLSDGLKEMLGGMRAVHSARRSYGLNAPRRADEGKTSMGIHFTEAPMPKPTIRSCAPIRGAAGNASMSMAGSRCASRT